MFCCPNSRSLIELNWFHYIIYWISKPVKNWCESFNWDKCFHFYPETGQTFLVFNLFIVLSPLTPALLSNQCSILLFLIFHLVLSGSFQAREAAIAIFSHQYSSVHKCPPESSHEHTMAFPLLLSRPKESFANPWALKRQDVIMGWNLQSHSDFPSNAFYLPVQ